MKSLSIPIFISKEIKVCFLAYGVGGIQWTQIKENEVMAISFKEDYGANAFWQLIEEYQRKYAITVPAAQGILFYF